MLTRTLLLLALLLNPAIGGEWTNYANARFGYSLGVPPGFQGLGEAENGDGQVFVSADGRKTLTVWGAHLMAGEFEQEAAQRRQWDADGGWTITYAAETPNWASYSGTRGGLALYTRLVPTCSGEAIAGFSLEYGQADLTAMNPVIERLVQDLRGGECQ